jgi:predicted Zn-dependent protease
MSQQAGVSGISTMMGWMMNDVTPATRQLAMQAFGMGARYGLLLPYSRKHETEADEIGLMLMSKAGYDPSEAPLFWGRFAEIGSSGTPEWASTHPSDQRRAAELAAKLPTAYSIYETRSYRFGRGESLV